MIGHRWPHPEDDRVFIARWNTLISALIVEPSVKLVARTAAEYGITNGEDIYPGNQRLARQTGYDPETIRQAWKVLRGTGLAIRDLRSQWDGKHRTSDLYALEIPADWRNLPIYGPHFKRFTCQHCGKLFNPRPGTVAHKDGTLGWFLVRMVFCPDPGTPRKRKNGTRPPQPPGCLSLWEQDRMATGLGGWRTLKTEAWELFRKARDDEWD